MSERDRDNEPTTGPASEAAPPADRDPDAFGAEWVDPDDAAEEMADETEGRS